MNHVRHSMLLAIHLGVGVRECLVIAAIHEFGLASSLNISSATGLHNSRSVELVNILRRKGLVAQHGVIDTVRPRPAGRPLTVKLWRLTDEANLKIVEWSARKRQATPAAVKRRKKSS